VREAGPWLCFSSDSWRPASNDGQTTICTTGSHFPGSRIADGKIVEGWNCWDMLGLLQQIGAVPAMGGART
jgi:hypothetical protein